MEQKRGHEQNSKAARVIYRSIEKIRGRKRNTGDSVFIQCPFHAGDDTPSARINLDGSSAPYGWLYCFGCGTSVPWNKVADRLGLDRVAQTDFRPDQMADHDTEGLRDDLLGHKELQLTDIAEAEGYGFMIPFPEDRAWRGIRGALLNKLGAMLIYDRHNEDTGVVLPVVAGGSLVGAIKASREKQEKSYMTSEGHWLKTKGLFPLDYAMEMTLFQSYGVLVLVEGPRDALRLISYGIPAVSILGSQSWSTAKRDLLLQMGVRLVVIMMDSDGPGIRATNKIYPMLKHHITTRTVKLKRVADKLGLDKVDPGNVPREYIQSLKQKLIRLCKELV